MNTRAISLLLLATASFALVACTPAAGQTTMASPTPGDAMTQGAATPSAGMQKDEGMMKGDTMPKPSATPADTMMKKDNAMGQPAATPADGMMKKDDGMIPAATPADSMQKDDGMMTPAATPGAGMTEKEEGMMKPGAMLAPADRYVAYSPDALAKASESGRAVLFFRADWCPTCRTADAEFKAKLDQIPGDVTILRVNYDTEAALKQQYTVTYQHTFVQVDASGKQVSRWNGGGLDDLLANLS